VSGPLEILSGFGAPQARGRIVGHSQAIRDVIALIQKVAKSQASILILGETGTGKELAARSIHDLRFPNGAPFVPVDCGSLVPTLVESELFGYVRGAFTGADSRRMGLLEAADGGTLFIDEIGELPLSLQARFLRVLQEREFRPLGSTRYCEFDAQIIAATSEDLNADVAAGKFREDLFYRLNVISLVLPPLRERKADIPLLAETMFQDLSAAFPAARPAGGWTLSPPAMECLLSYDWPGNVRELGNCLEYAVTMGRQPVLQIEDLPAVVRDKQSLERTEPASDPLMLCEIERQGILRALSQTGGNKGMAARLLGIGKTTLYRKLKRYGAL
jgi:transcriptional regulator with PAS, ATPase and Fis domain